MLLHEKLKKSEQLRQEQVAQAIQEFRKSEAYLDEMTSYALDSFNEGFAMCKEQVQKLFPELDLEAVQVVAEAEDDARTEMTGVHVGGNEPIDLDQEGVSVQTTEAGEDAQDDAETAHSEA